MTGVRSLVELLDECRYVGGVDFGEAIHGIDARLGSMTMIVMARRMRDIMKLAEARIGILAAALDDRDKAIEDLRTQIESTHDPAEQLEKAAIEALYIGHGATHHEISDYTEANDSTGIYNRFGLAYDDLDDDWMTTQLTSRSVLREPRRTSSNPLVKGRVDSGIGIEVRADNTMETWNRFAQIAPKEDEIESVEDSDSDE